MAKSNGIKSLKQAAKLLNRHSPDGESLAYINPEEARVLRARGGSGIMTLAGVPSYAWYDFLKPVGKAIAKYAPKVLELGQKYAPNLFGGEWGDSGGNAQAATINQPRSMMTEYDDAYWQTPGINPYSTEYGGLPPTDPALSDTYSGGGNFLADLAKGAWTGIKERYTGKDALKNIGGDLGKAYLTVKAYGGTKKLNTFQEEELNRALADIEAGEAQFASNIGAAPLEITNQPSRADLAQFTETTGRPDMITTPTAAQGGRIGAFNGGIQGLMPQQGMPQQGFMPQPGLMPQQGLMPPQGLDPRMGYALGDEVEQVTETVDMPQDMQMADLDDIPDWYLMDFEKLLEDFRIDNNGNNPSSINELEKWYRFKRTTVAHGGRIGYAEGDYITRRPERGRSPAGRSATEVRSLDMDMEWGGPEQVETARRIHYLLQE